MRRFLLNGSLILLFSIGSAMVCHGQSGSKTDLPLTTKKRIQISSWWPTRQATDQKEMVGAEACAKCHASIARSQETSQMAHTLSRASESTVLANHAAQTYRSGPFVYTLNSSQQRVRMKVSDGVQSREADLDWAFGSGEVGQSYLWTDANGSYKEARFNYFASIDNLGATPGRLHGPPSSLDMALGRQVEGFEAKSCFACHTTVSAQAKSNGPNGLTAGVHCEACHGPGARHVSAMQARTAEDQGPAVATTILNPSNLTPVQAVDFCGACHSTSWDVRLTGATGLQTVRFPAYRLEKSRCWGSAGDTRLECQSCHDPHEPLNRNAAAYDGACLSCHRSGGSDAALHTAVGPACPVAKSKCSTCHMQKYELPELHARFTDHKIRIPRNDNLVPD